MERLLPWLGAAVLLLPLLLVPLALLARRRRGRQTPPLSLLVVAGSGGHTTEVLRLLSCLSESYSPRHYILADSDKMSEAKIRSFEQKRAEIFSNSQILCNGPGTCVPVCISALLLGLLGLKRAIIVYVESICRVETLSLSGKILYYFSDHFIVQWPALKEKYPKSVYLGRIV
ncbi:UDP-N-acetylglucosamine transferase subunit ALG14 homolog isoform X2 [Rhea pennata]|uniref:UDP-N-acetylglucosamine transferase subunit ALG14 homolog isoform X2 n=1 Tax=Rhea pennata TaxID=8795 RepID=UPI002E2683A2